VILTRRVLPAGDDGVDHGDCSEGHLVEKLRDSNPVAQHHADLWRVLFLVRLIMQNFTVELLHFFYVKHARLETRRLKIGHWKNK
jgi:hypothetical protein